MMDDALGDLEFCFVYMDDLLVACKDEVEHVEHLWVIFQRLREAGLVLNVEKCQFGVPSVDYLGHHVAAVGVTAPKQCGGCQELSPASQHQADDVFSRHTEFLPALHSRGSQDAETTDRCSKRQATEGAHVVRGDEKLILKEQGGSLPRGNLVPSRSSSTSFLGGGCVRHAHGGSIPAASTRGGQSHWVSSQRIWTLLRRSIQLSTGSCWRATWE